MNLLLRLLATLIGARRRSPLGPLDESVMTLRVLPTDVDANLHMNNGRYLSIMDLGRFDLTVRNGLLRATLRRGWRPVVGSVVIRYRRSLDPLQRYELRTRAVCWDEKWIYLEQRFERGGEVAAIGLVKALFVGKSGSVPTRDVFATVGFMGDSPPMPESVELWRRSEAAMTG
ncbi:MAG TPA: thioesterase family protein [Gemmatimonadaceae bacterium]